MQPTTTARTPPATRLAAAPTAVLGRVIVVHSPAGAPPRPRRRRVAARGQAALVWAAVAFVAGQLALAAAIECRLPQLRDPNYGQKERRLLQRLSASPAPPRTVLMLGSSRTMYGLRGQDVEQALAGPDGRPLVFNLGLPGAGPLTELMVLRRLLRQGVRPDLLLVEVLAPVLAGQVHLAEVAHWEEEPGRLWHGDLPLAERYLPGVPLRAGWWAAAAVPCHSLRRAMLSALAPELLPLERQLNAFRVIDDSGWTALPHVKKEAPRRRQATDRARGEYAHYFNGFRLGGPSPPALRELLDLCRERGIPAVMVMMPEGSEFRGWYPPAAWQEMAGFLTGLGRKYGVEVIDAREWLPDEEFADGHHQFPEGAVRFSRRVARQVIAPRLKE
jgi:hypothetical protein